MKIKQFRGHEIHNADLGSQSWFGCGGKADLLFHPADIQDLQEFFDRNTNERITIIGGLANTIIRDGGIRGITVQLGKSFSEIKPLQQDMISAQCGALNGSVAAAAIKSGIGELEFLSGIPGSLGGAIAMNAGAYGTEIKDVLVQADILMPDGSIKTMAADDLKMSYRHSEIPDGGIIISAVLKGGPEEYDAIKTRMNDIKARRNETQPIREKTGGSTFANPSPEELIAAGLPEGTKAWKIVEMVGGRGLKMGGAMISEQHCNFMINTGDATAADLENLGEELIRRADEKFGLRLRWEIKRIGEAR